MVLVSFKQNYTEVYAICNHFDPVTPSISSLRKHMLHLQHPCPIRNEQKNAMLMKKGSASEWLRQISLTVQQKELFQLCG